MMNSRLKILLSISFFLLASVLLFVFRFSPESRIWNGFRVLFVSSSYSDADVIDVLEKHDIGDFVYRTSQETDAFDVYFSDKSGEFNLFYIPDEHGSVIGDVVSEIRNGGAEGVGLDGSAEYDVTVPVCALLFFVALIVFTSSKIEFFFEGLLFVALVFSRPVPALMGASCLSMLGLLQLVRYRRRFVGFAGASLFRLLKSNVVSKDFSLISIAFLIFAPLFVVIFSDGIGTLLFLLVLAVSLFEFFFADFDSFSSARFFSTKAFGRIVMFSLVLASFFLGMFVQSRISESSSNDSRVSVKSDAQPVLPSPVLSQDSSLPNFETYVVSEWKRMTYPYRKLSEPMDYDVHEDDFVSLTEYSEVDGKIISEDKKIFVFNNDFRKMVYDSSVNVPNSICRMLVSQDSDCFGYSSGKSSSASSLSLAGGDFVSLFSCLLILFVFSGYHLFMVFRKGMMQGRA
ncbi:MAG: hypothetical protein IKO57_01450 [Treponema sp.]|nr:hypothetical protein [Treponema sp.]